MGSHNSKAPSTQENVYCKVCAGNFEPQAETITAQSSKLAKPEPMPVNLISLIEISANHKRQPSIGRYLPHTQQPYVQKNYVHQVPIEQDYHHVGVPSGLDMLEYHRSTTPVPVPLALPSNFNPNSYNIKQLPSVLQSNPYKDAKIVYHPVQYKFIPKQTPAARNDIASYYEQLLPNQVVKQRRINVI